MKLVQLFVLSALVLFTAVSAHADGVSTDDLRIIVGGDPPPGGCTPKKSGFDISPNSKGGGFTECKNDTGVGWTGVTITGHKKAGDMSPIMFGSGSGFLCNGTSDDTNKKDSFTTCMMMQDKNNKVILKLTGGQGISAGSGFFIDLNSNGDTTSTGKGMGPGNWDGPLTIVPIVAAPEPGTIVLLLAGLGGVWSWRKREGSNANA
jgi:hypothetical protein